MYLATRALYPKDAPAFVQSIKEKWPMPSNAPELWRSFRSLENKNETTIHVIASDSKRAKQSPRRDYFGRPRLPRNDKRGEDFVIHGIYQIYAFNE